MKQNVYVIFGIFLFFYSYKINEILIIDWKKNKERKEKWLYLFYLFSLITSIIIQKKTIYNWKKKFTDKESEKLWWKLTKWGEWFQDWTKVDDRRALIVVVGELEARGDQFEFSVPRRSKSSSRVSIFCVVCFVSDCLRRRRWHAGAKKRAGETLLQEEYFVNYTSGVLRT